MAPGVAIVPPLFLLSKHVMPYLVRNAFQSISLITDTSNETFVSNVIGPQSIRRNTEKAKIFVVSVSRLHVIICFFLWYQATERLETAQEKVEMLTEHFTKAGESLRNLEAKDEDASEREQVNEEKMSFLLSQVKEILALAEDHERKIPPLQRTIDQMSEEIRDWQSKTKEVTKEMEDMEALVGESISDDENDIVSKSEPKTSSTKETSQEEKEAAQDDEKDEEDEDEDGDEEEEEDWHFVALYFLSKRTRDCFLIFI